MGRVKLKIKKLETIGNRQVTYSKRRNGIMKKARELSILCDIDIVLLMFSPTGKPTFFHGERSTIEEVIAKFAQVPPQERAKRKLESLEALKKTFKKLDHDVNIQDFVGPSTQIVEDLTDEARSLQGRLKEVQKRLSFWSDPDKVDSVDTLSQMEDLLRDLINQLHLRKENVKKHQFLSLECASQFGNGLPLSLMLGDMQESQPLSWLSTSENPRILLSNEPNFLSHQEMECSTGAPIQRYSSYLDAGKQAEICNSGQLDNIGQEPHALNMGQEAGSSNELNRGAFLSLQLGEQFTYPPYNSLNLPDPKNLNPPMEVNLLGNPAAYQVNSNFQLPGPYDNRQQWVSASGPCGIAMFDENPFQRQTN